MLFNLIEVALGVRGLHSYCTVIAERLCMFVSRHSIGILHAHEPLSPHFWGLGGVLDRVSVLRTPITTLINTYTTTAQKLHNISQTLINQYLLLLAMSLVQLYNAHIILEFVYLFFKWHSHLWEKNE